MTRIYNRPTIRPLLQTSTQVLVDRHFNLDVAIEKKLLHPSFPEHTAKLMKLCTKLEIIRRATQMDDVVAHCYGAKRGWPGFVVDEMSTSLDKMAAVAAE